MFFESCFEKMSLYIRFKMLKVSNVSDAALMGRALKSIGPYVEYDLSE